MQRKALNESRLDEATTHLGKCLPCITTIPSDHDYMFALKLLETLSQDPNACPLKEHLLVMIVQRYEEHSSRFSAYSRVGKSKSPELSMVKKIIHDFVLSLDELAEIGKKHFVERVLKGERPLTLTHIKALSARFNIPVAKFF